MIEQQHPRHVWPKCAAGEHDRCDVKGIRVKQLGNREYRTTIYCECYCHAQRK